MEFIIIVPSGRNCNKGNTSPVSPVLRNPLKVAMATGSHLLQLIRAPPCHNHNHIQLTASYSGSVQQFPQYISDPPPCALAICIPMSAHDEILRPIRNPYKPPLEYQWEAHQRFALFSVSERITQQKQLINVAQPMDIKNSENLNFITSSNNNNNNNNNINMNKEEYKASTAAVPYKEAISETLPT
ncbi:unnamed protein product [Trichobilharzia regenti]|nr:unnamed protein product [Trichobilharzia regenti]